MNEMTLDQALSAVGVIANTLYEQSKRADTPEVCFSLFYAYEKAQELYDDIASAILASAEG